MTKTQQDYKLITEAGKYSQAECHDIAKMLCIIRDFGEDSNLPEDKLFASKAETILQAFINRKKLGTSVSFKKLYEEFDFEP